jgi:hypothetical protein
MLIIRSSLLWLGLEALGLCLHPRPAAQWFITATDIDPANYLGSQSESINPAASARGSAVASYPASV